MNRSEDIVEALKANGINISLLEEKEIIQLLESDESHWEREELPHTCITCRYNSVNQSEAPCFNCVDYNHWEERE